MTTPEPPTPMTDETRRDRASPRCGSIDALRGLSILLVVMHHVGLRIPLREGALAAATSRRFVSALIYNGYEAVFIFFVISGFLITTNALGRWASLDRIDVRAFYLRRAARILPCLLLLVAVLSALHLAGVKDYVIARAGQSLAGAIASALGLYLNWYEGHYGYLPGAWDILWSLSIEEVFYLTFPLVCLITRRLAVLAPLLAALALSLPASRAALQGNEIWQEKAYLPGMAGIAAGVLGALAAARFTVPRQRVLILIATLGGAGIGAVLFIGDLLWPLIGNGSVLLLTASATGLVVVLHWWHTQGRLARLRGTGWLQAMGRLSYEIYLTHMFVVFAVVRVFRASGSGIFYGFLWYLPAVGLSWGLGALLARYVSIPCEAAIKRRFIQRMTAR